MITQDKITLFANTSAQTLACLVNAIYGTSIVSIWFWNKRIAPVQRKQDTNGICTVRSQQTQKRNNKTNQNSKLKHAAVAKVPNARKDETDKKRGKHVTGANRRKHAPSATRKRVRVKSQLTEKKSRVGKGGSPTIMLLDYVMSTFLRSSSFFRLIRPVQILRNLAALSLAVLC